MEWRNGIWGEEVRRCKTNGEVRGHLASSRRCGQGSAELTRAQVSVAQSVPKLP